jgi:putative membrane protein
VRASTIEELLLAGATENRVGAIMAGILGIVELFDQLGAAVRGPFRQVLEPVFGRGALTAVVMVTLSAVALLAAGGLVSVLVTLVNFHGFTLRRLGGELRRRHGLLTQFEAALPIPRIQVLRLEANPLRRFMGYLGVRAETAGSAKDQEAGGATTLCPLLRRAEAGPFCRVVFPDLDLEGTALRPVHPLAFRRGFVRFLLLSLAGVAAAVPALGPRALWALAAAVPAAAVLARLRYRALGFASPGRFLLARAGVWTRRLWVVPREKVQSAALSQGPIQRWLRLATLSVDTAGAGPLRQARIIDLPVEEARALLDGLAA